MQIEIDAGLLDLELHRGAARLDELLGFASRQNPKRGYLFVSKVLGKHIPVRPHRMRALYAELAEACAAVCPGLPARAGRRPASPRGLGVDAGTDRGVDPTWTGPGPTGADRGGAAGCNAALSCGPTLVVGMAETATGLGAGVADELARRCAGGPVFFMHTTRHCLPVAPWITLDEVHSHAVEQLLYPPGEALAHLLPQVCRLLLVDDEMSTGRTLGLLARRLLSHLPALTDLLFVSIVDWLTPHDRSRLASLPASVHFVSVLQGRFVFRPRPGFAPRLPATLDGGLAPGPAREDLGRRGLGMPHREVFAGELAAAFGPLPEPAACPPLAVIGTGEHLFLPFLLAEALEREGYDVLFQSTTRSPILIGGAIRRKLELPLDKGRVHHYCYNLDPARRPLPCHEFPGFGAGAARPLSGWFEASPHAR